ncbi:MAG: hypothetical protein HUJ53_09145, partial [Holdemanella sp.]|nr:hypothetical protein [Holdemanella sp.]
LYDTDLVQIDNYSIYKIEDKFFAKVNLKSFTDKPIEKVNLMIHCFGMQRKVLIENMPIEQELNSADLIYLDANKIVSMSCSILSVVVEGEVIDYSKFDIFYIDRKKKFKDKYTEKEIASIQFINKFDTIIHRDTYLPNKANQYAINLEGELVLAKDYEELFAFMDEISSSIEEVCKYAFYKKGLDAMDKHEYPQAILYFDECIGYEDAYELKEECIQYINTRIANKKVEVIEEETEEIRPFTIKGQIQEFKDTQDESYMKYLKFILLGFFILCVVLIFNFNKGNKVELVLKNKTVELGDPVTLNINQYIDKSKSTNIQDIDFEMKTELMTSDAFEYNEEDKTVKTKDKKFLDVGEYKITITDKEGKYVKDTTLKVVDTTPPKITVRPIQIKVSDTEIKYNEYLTVKDYSECTFDVDSSKVEIGKEGSYEAKVSAEDKYGNKSEATIKVKVDKDDRVFYQGIYSSYYDVPVYADENGLSFIRSIPSGSKIMITYTIQNEDGSYWAVLSNGYIKIADDEYDYLYLSSYIGYLRSYFDTIEEFISACGVEEGSIKDDDGKDYEPLNYTLDCQGDFVFY